jgi:hypothetical protein
VRTAGPVVRSRTAHESSPPPPALAGAASDAVPGATAAASALALLLNLSASALPDGGAATVGDLDPYAAVWAAAAPLEPAAWEMGLLLPIVQVSTLRVTSLGHGLARRCIGPHP